MMNSVRSERFKAARLRGQISRGVEILLMVENSFFLKQISEYQRLYV